MRNEREFLETLTKNHFDVFLVSETKLDYNFPRSEFAIPSCKLFYKDRNQHGGGLIFYVNQDISCKTINIFSLEINLRLIKKVLVIGCYKPHDENFLDQLHGALSFYSTKYDNVFC